MQRILIAIGAALLLLASPLALYYGSVGLTYAPEMLASIVVAGMAWGAVTYRWCDNGGDGTP